MHDKTCKDYTRRRGDAEQCATPTGGCKTVSGRKVHMIQVDCAHPASIRLFRAKVQRLQHKGQHPCPGA
nr:hypothetical protein CFP56_31826 [Quercus suber]